MPKRNKLPKFPDYTGIPRDDYKLVVQKSNPLQTLSETKLSLAQFKILDAYLSRIDSHDEEKRYVRFKKGELEKILGVTKISKEDLHTRLENLFQTVTIKDANKRKGFTIIALFEKAEVYCDDDGLCQVDLACTSSALEYMFNIENLGYLRYRLKNIIDLTSRYSYILYLYLENNRFRKSWKISLSELKKILNCTAESYNKYKEFNDKILKKCQQELNKKTNLKFSYLPVDKKGRTYTAIQFTVQALSDVALVRQFEDDKNFEINYGSELSDLLGSASCDDEFTSEQIRVIQDLVIRVFPYSTDYMAMCDYLIMKVHKMNLYDADRKTIKNRFSYLCKMIEKDIAKQKG